MEALVQSKNVPLLKVDIVRWGSPVAEQYGIQQLPSLWMYRDGELVSRDSPTVFRQLSTL
ncbi:MAG: hypothetical protein KC729_01355 [Candidatus Eisenbacteria bacterium]|uniref:Thioredoxin domain-containing protein n=1 Tax=Eiseniibacteriota bacterium TaxID=2212470 RepID=A0A956RNZ3_UNCEI|nr:hypothetical protein [Candidatus Eisenbacteria bacterium]